MGLILIGFYNHIKSPHSNFQPVFNLIILPKVITSSSVNFVTRTSLQQQLHQHNIQFMIFFITFSWCKVHIFIAREQTCKFSNYPTTERAVDQIKLQIKFFANNFIFFHFHIFNLVNFNFSPTKIYYSSVCFVVFYMA